MSTIRTVSDDEIVHRIRLENPWWKPPHQIDDERFEMPRRAYFDLVFPYLLEREPRRALVLMGPRRVGKTVILHQAIQKLIDEGTDPQKICFLDIQTPLYNGITLERLIELFFIASAIEPQAEVFVFFDEVQYLNQWEVHLKNLVDRFPNVKLIASGSAAAALRLASTESGAGRFTDFLLPPITFYEYLSLVREDDLIWCEKKEDGTFQINWFEEIERINELFFSYLNVGGYPEAIFSSRIQADPGRYIRSDIIDKVLMKDLPSLYGIHDIQELNSLFTMLAYNTAGEVSLDGLSKNAGIAKNTIKRYIDYLESAFLVKVVHRVDRNAKRFSRANFFKVYLTNPCMRSALFSPLEQDSEGVGSLVETGVFAQWFHYLLPELFYARWDSGAGEVDLVKLSAGTLKPVWAVEVKWTDSCIHNLHDLKSFRKFLGKNPDCEAAVLTRTYAGTGKINDHDIKLIPCAIYCYYIGWLIIQRKQDTSSSVSLLEVMKNSDG